MHVGYSQMPRYRPCKCACDPAMAPCHSHIQQRSLPCSCGSRLRLRQTMPATGKLLPAVARAKPGRSHDAHLQTSRFPQRAAVADVHGDAGAMCLPSRLVLTQHLELQANARHRSDGTHACPARHCAAGPCACAGRVKPVDLQRAGARYYCSTRPCCCEQASSQAQSHKAIQSHDEPKRVLYCLILQTDSKSCSKPKVWTVKSV